MLDEKNYNVDEDEEEDDYRDIFAHLWKEYIKENKPGYYGMLRITGALDEEAKKIDIEAQKMYYNIIERTAERDGVNEELKRKDMFEYAGLYNNIVHAARDYILHEFIYV